MSRTFSEQVAEFMKLFRGRTDWYGHRAFASSNAWYEGKRDENGDIIYMKKVYAPISEDFWDL